MRERELGALGVHGSSDAPGNGTVRGQADDQRAFTAQKTHCYCLHALRATFNGVEATPYFHALRATFNGVEATPTDIC